MTSFPPKIWFVVVTTTVSCAAAVEYDAILVFSVSFLFSSIPIHATFLFVETLTVPIPSVPYVASTFVDIQTHQLFWGVTGCIPNPTTAALLSYTRDDLLE